MQAPDRFLLLLPNLCAGEMGLSPARERLSPQPFAVRGGRLSGV